MLNIELIRFEAQDVITASGVQKPTSVPATNIQVYCGFCQKYVDRNTECENSWVPGYRHP